MTAILFYRILENSFVRIFTPRCAPRLLFVWTSRWNKDGRWLYGKTAARQEMCDKSFKEKHELLHRPQRSLNTMACCKFRVVRDRAHVSVCISAAIRPGSISVIDIHISASTTGFISHRLICRACQTAWLEWSPCPPGLEGEHTAAFSKSSTHCTRSSAPVPFESRAKDISSSILLLLHFPHNNEKRNRA